MKKILRFLFATMLIFAMFACDNSSNSTTGGGQSASGDGGSSTGGGSSSGGDSVVTPAQSSIASKFELSITDEVNLFRKNPENYFNTYIKDQDDWYTNQQKAKFNTHEGYSSLQTDVSGKTTDLGQLAWLDGIYRCAKKHCNELLEANKMQHDRLSAPTQLTVPDVVNNEFVEKGAIGVFCEPDPSAMGIGAGENLSGSMNTARNIVIQLLLDDNVSSRGHRRNLMNTDFKQIGTAFGEKAGYTAGGTLNPTLCVMDFGFGYKNKE